MTPSEIAVQLDGEAFNYNNPLFAQAAATIRAQAEALKIATEALQKMVTLYESENDPENIKRPQWLVDALARIKEA